MSALLKTSLENLELVQGEKEPKKTEDVLLDGEVATLSSTNFRLLFQLGTGVLISVPLHSILYIVYKSTSLRASSSIILHLQGMHSLVLSSRAPDKLHKTIVKLVRGHKNTPHCYLSPYDVERARYAEPGDYGYFGDVSPLSYFASLVESGVDTRWRRSDINHNYHLIPDYPPVLCVPQGVSDKTLQAVSGLMHGGRLPVLTWTNPVTRTSIFRGGVLLEGELTGKALEYWNAVKESAKPRTAQPILVEGECDNLSETSSIALCMENEHEISKILWEISKKSVRETFCPENITEIARWERRLRSTLNSTKAVANMVLTEHKSVLLQSDSRDGPLFTVSALAQLLIDARFRTLSGFCALIEKEFVFFGFPFALAADSSRRSQNSESLIPQYSGGFLLFLDSVWALLSQMGHAFQFTKELIVFLFDVLSAGLYDTFNTSSEKERKTEVSYRCVWATVFRSASRFLNPHFAPVSSDQLLRWCENGFSTHWNSWIFHRKIAFTDFNNDPLDELDTAFYNKQLEMVLQSKNLSYIHRSWLPLFEHVAILDLSHNYLTDFPVEVLELQHLRNLDLDYNFINKLPFDSPVQYKTKLRLLSLNHNAIVYFPADWKLPTSLRCLSIRYNKLRMFRMNDSDSELVQLELGYNTITDFSVTAQKLRILSLHTNCLMSVPACVGLLGSLTTLDLGNNQLRGPFDSDLSQLSSLTSLNLSFVDLTQQQDSLKDSFFRLTSLKELFLAYCFKEESGVSVLSQLVHLEKLNLDGNFLTQFPAVLTRFTHLQKLSLESNEICTLPYEPLLRFKSLSFLNIRRNNITSLPSSLACLQALRDSGKFLFENNPLSDEYKVNGIFPTARMIFSLLDSKLEGEPTPVDNTIPIVSLYFVGPSASGKRELVHSYFPECLNLPSSAPFNGAVTGAPLPNTVTFLPVVAREVNDHTIRMRIRIYAGHEAGDLPFYDWYLRHTRPIFVCVWRSSQPAHSASIRYWMETARHHPEDHRLIVIAFRSESYMTSAEVERIFYSEYPPDKFPIYQLIVLHRESLSQSLPLFMSTLAGAIYDPHSIEEEIFPLSAETERLVKFFKERESYEKAPYVALEEFINEAHRCGIEGKPNITQMIRYLHQTGAALCVGNYVVLNVLWFNLLLNRLSPSHMKPSWNEQGMIDLPQLTQNLVNVAPKADIHETLKLLRDSRVICYYENCALFPSVLPFTIDPSKKGAFWRTQYSSTTVYQQYQLRFAPPQMVHQLAVSVFEKVTETLDISSFVGFALGEWTIKEPSCGNYIFFRISQQNGTLVLAAVSDTPLYNVVCTAVNSVMREWRYLTKSKDSTSKTLVQTHSGNWVSWK